MGNLGSGQGNLLKQYFGITVSDCATHCNAESSCVAFTFFPPTLQYESSCKLKSALGSQLFHGDRNTYVKASTRNGAPTVDANDTSVENGGGRRLRRAQRLV